LLVSFDLNNYLDFHLKTHLTYEDWRFLSAKRLQGFHQPFFWDLWRAEGHLFCRKCSSQTLFGCSILGILYDPVIWGLEWASRRIPIKHLVWLVWGPLTRWFGFWLDPRKWQGLGFLGVSPIQIPNHLNAAQKGLKNHWNSFIFLRRFSWQKCAQFLNHQSILFWN